MNWVVFPFFRWEAFSRNDMKISEAEEPRSMFYAEISLDLSMSNSPWRLMAYLPS